MAKPDLILLGGWVDQGVEKQLKKIAPVLRSYGQQGDWQAALQKIAEALNCTDRAQAFLQRYQEQLRAVRTGLGEQASSSVSIVRWNPKGPSFMYADSFARQVLNDVGMTCPEQQRVAGPGHSEAVSFEQLALIDADWIFMGSLAASGEAQQALRAAQANPAFEQLQATQVHQVVVVDGSLWTSGGGALAAMEILQDIANALE